MDHVAIMNPRWRLIEKILTGQKTIESRWYVHKISPWGKISAGETIYFKDAGKKVTAKAEVEQIIEIEIDSKETAIEFIHEYQDKLCFTPESLLSFDWLNGKKYGMLIFLKNAQEITPFAIDKTGYGNACAWICTPDISRVKQ